MHHCPLITAVKTRGAFVLNAGNQCVSQESSEERFSGALVLLETRLEVGDASDLPRPPAKRRDKRRCQDHVCFHPVATRASPYPCPTQQYTCAGFRGPGQVGMTVGALEG